MRPGDAVLMSQELHDSQRTTRENDEVLTAIETAASSELAHIDAALDRMNDGVFGTA